MPILRIEHSVPNFDMWKQAFDADPADRKGSGVRSYRVMHSIDDPNFVLIDLEFDSVGDAAGLLEKMRTIWDGPGARFMQNPVARIVESVEQTTLQ